MSQRAAASLSTLPVEMLHRIFNELDGTTTLLSVRDVCPQLRAAVETYHPYSLDFTSLSKPDFHRLLSLIRPECVTGLSLSDGEMTPGQIGRFISLVDIGLFTRIRSLKLLYIDGKDLCRFLEHAGRLLLTSLTLQPRSRFALEADQVLRHLSSIIVQDTLLRLKLLDADLGILVNQFQGPIKFRFQYLTLPWNSGCPACEMVASSPALTTLVLDNKSDSWSFFDEPSEWFSTPSSRFTSLTLLGFSLRMPDFYSFLSQTPSLRHLKIVTRSDYMINGSRWEKIIKNKLLFLHKFEFYAIFCPFNRETQMGKSALTKLIAPFCTPFWTEEKRWRVICNVFPVREKIEMYTSPICKSSYTHISDPKTMTISNFERKDQHSTVLESVNELRVDLSTILVNGLASRLNRSITRFLHVRERFLSRNTIEAIFLSRISAQTITDLHRNLSRRWSIFPK